MINRVYIEDFLSFKSVELELNKGLIVFTGPSGAGKSILMDSLLSLFAYKEFRASMGEVLIENAHIEDEAFMLENDDDIIIKATKKDKVRYFLNNQTVSKKNLFEFSKRFVKFLHVKDTSDFESAKLVSFLDHYLQLNDKEFNAFKEQFNSTFTQYKQALQRLKKIEEDEAKIEDLKEFTKFEIEKIASIDPKVEEYEELSALKRNLSSKDKIQEAITQASDIFTSAAHVSHALELLDVDSSFFDEAINEVNNQFEKFNDSLGELEELDIEYVLDRIEKLSSLQKKFGSIQEALDYKEQKQKELEEYENISFEKSQLQKKYKLLNEQITQLAHTLTSKREAAAQSIELKINDYLKYLYLSNATIHFHNKELDESGADVISFELNGVNLETISSGEFNRLRLALLTTISEFEMGEKGVLFLDEIDANLSGKESKAIATVLTKLSQSYQIFAISHQPQLTSTAHQHFFVDKHNGESHVKELSHDERVDEIARMISGENITKEAKEFASNLLSEA